MTSLAGHAQTAPPGKALDHPGVVAAPRHADAPPPPSPVTAAAAGHVHLAWPGKLLLAMAAGSVLAWGLVRVGDGPDQPEQHTDTP